MITAKN